MSATEIAIGSRGSALALAQAKLVQDALEGEGHASRIVIIETAGDRRPPDTAWGEGAFVAAIEQALLDGVIDVAVHSAKDIPTEVDPRLRIAAYLPRADPRDALVVRSDARQRRLADLPRGVRVGTDSPRRTGFLLARRPDLLVHPLHGNVDTRLRWLDAGETDALLLACAGLERMGLGHRIAERLDPEVVPPAPGQGAIAVQVRSQDERMLAAAAATDDRDTRLAVEAERSFLRASGGGCRAPIGALARIVDDELELLGGYASADGGRITIARRRGPLAAGEELGRGLAVEIDPGTRVRTTARTAGSGGRHPRRRVLVTRAVDQAGELLSALRQAGLDPIEVPAIAIELEPAGGDLDHAARHVRFYAWVVISSTNGALAVLKAAERVFTPFEASRFAVIGSTTRRILEREGVDVDFQPSMSSAAAMGAELPVRPGDRVLAVRGDLADEDLAVALRARGAEVNDVIAYRTREGPEGSRALLRRATADGPIAAVVFTSGSTVRGLASLGEAESIDVRAFSAVCIGPETADEARAAGFQILAVSPTPDSAALAVATASALKLHPQETE
ncbi:MAG TPA: hydroxymethylbilane synthase [Candidatus Limnocylindrales bacterium]|nr:hydroxymethylbilane synthase [Candidatus Limnocylindrales bacterium]